MGMPLRLKRLYRKLGLIDKAFVVLLLLDAVLAYALPSSGIGLLVTFATWIAGIVVAFRLARRGVTKLIWRLRNRLIVAYAFIAMVPVVLILVLVLVSTYGLTGQIALYLINSELDRRTGILRGAAGTVADAPTDRRQDVLARTHDFTQRFFPDCEFLVSDGAEYRYPPSSAIALPGAAWKDANGIIVKGHQLYSWAHLNSGRTQVLIMAPLSQDFLSNLVPGIGRVTFRDFAEAADEVENASQGAPAAGGIPSTRIPPKNNFLDIQVKWGSLVPVMFWNSPGNRNNRGLLLVNTRMSAVLSTVFGNNIALGDMAYGQVIWGAFLVTVTLFLIVELVSLVIGVSISRTITSAVHELYLGTRRVKEGDFSHRIPVRGNDQLAELGTSFNTMTENLERLIVVAKEKERLESELEIAREVQSQLFPKNVPDMKSLQLTGVCNPARVVSGDYYDFIRFDSSLAFAIGDVAGQGHLRGAADGGHPVHHADAAHRGRSGHHVQRFAASFHRHDGLAPEQTVVCQHFAREVCHLLLRPVRREDPDVDLHQRGPSAAHPAAQGRARASAGHGYRGGRISLFALRRKNGGTIERRRAGGLYRWHHRARERIRRDVR